MKGFYPGTFIADKLDFSNRIRRRITISILVLSDSFCLAVALVESGFWAKTINPSLTWANATSYLFGQEIGLRADPLLRISILGASGAISGILGGYLVLYPKEKIEIEVFARAIKIPIAFAAWAWAISQVVSAFALQPDLNGTAYIAHVGGFASGIVLAKILSKSAPPKQKRKFG